MDEKLRKLMKQEGLNSTRLAEMLGIQASGISHIMSGRNKPSYDFLVKLLQRFPQINPDWLLMDKGPMYRDALKSKAVPESPAVFSPVNIPATTAVASSIGEGLFSNPRVGVDRDDEDIIPSDRPVAKTPAQQMSIPTAFSPSSSIERIVVFYKDRTFSEYKPEQN